MTVFERVKELCKERGITIVQLEEKVGFGKNSIYSWKKNKPSTEKLEKVADYFDVSTDYLLGRTNKKRYYDLTEKDERDIQKELQKMIEGLSEGGYAAFDGKDIDELDEETKQYLIESLESTLRFSKIMAKKKFTPKKYRD
ncbi:transcriptional regulator [Shouchella clausii]|uniref:helix-turn-helix domain-containing protein n=1 Tax=Shouchella clausii TaxID=79880 RepID=UPI000BA57F70|nr:helix-turn-helix transcriptional regulator [Shouchella clausii]PAF13662.1 transcriptional regulator [Shouchella clausii]